MTIPGRIECERCRRPLVACYCAHLPNLQTQTRVLVLSHPREYDNPVGTAHMASLCLPNSRVAVGVEFADDPVVQAELSDPARPAFVLYPGEQAKDLALEPPQGPCTLVVVDGTWAHARSIVRKNPFLRALPCYAFAPPRPSEYRIRREPRADYVSTLEALMHALALIEGDGERFTALLAPFRAMVETQLGFAHNSPGGRKRTRRRRNVAAPARLPAELIGPELVCVMGEANAWPYDRERGCALHPHELVQWLAFRLSDGAHFDALIAPRAPLSRSPIVHSGLAEAELRSGSSVADFARAWSEFLRPDDVLCTWGPYPLGLMIRELGPPSQPVVDLRKVTGDYTKQRPGSIDARLESLGIPWQAMGRGRGGQRLGALAEVTRWLVGLAHGR